MNDPNHVDELTLTDYLDDALVPDQRVEVEQHLAGCAACAAHVAEFRALFTALDELPPLILERDLAPAVIAAIQSTPAPAYRVWGLGGVLAGQLALVAVLVVALWHLLLPSLTELQVASGMWWSSLDFTPILIQAQLAWDRAISPFQRMELPTFSDVTGISALSWTTAAGVFMLAAVVWLAGNRLLLVPTNDRKTGFTALK
jgi:predicted anti-sigma-YlaC factor YlaD